MPETGQIIAFVETLREPAPFSGFCWLPSPFCGFRSVAIHLGGDLPRQFQGKLNDRSRRSGTPKTVRGISVSGNAGSGTGRTRRRIGNSRLEPVRNAPADARHRSRRSHRHASGHGDGSGCFDSNSGRVLCRDLPIERSLHPSGLEWRTAADFGKSFSFGSNNLGSPGSNDDSRRRQSRPGVRNVQFCTHSKL